MGPSCNPALCPIWGVVSNLGLSYHEAANCAAFGLNTAGLFGILVGNCFVLWSAMYTLTYHQIVTWRLERGCYVIGALIVVVSGTSTGALCRQVQ